MHWRSRWQPLSAVSLPDSGQYLSTALARFVLARQRAIDVRFWGDAMEPTIRHGQQIQVLEVEAGALQAGQIALVLVDHAVELCRLESVTASTVWLTSDADPRPARSIDLQNVLGIAAIPTRRSRSTVRKLRRALLDLREAWQRDGNSRSDRAESVREKYTTQAPFYADSDSSTISSGVREWMRAEQAATGTWLVAGCGAGSECRELRTLGCDVIGIDFSAAMIELARERSDDPKLRFLTADLRALPDDIAALSGVLFTPNVYSFVPLRADRVRLLRHLRRIVRPGGACLLAARMVETRWNGLMAAIEWMRSPSRRAEWGDSHTRWISSSGQLERSFVKLFRPAILRREIVEGGWKVERRLDGCWLLR